MLHKWYYWNTKGGNHTLYGFQLSVFASATKCPAILILPPILLWSTKCCSLNVLSACKNAKGVVLTHGNLIANAAGFSRAVKFYPSDV